MKPDACSSNSVLVYVNYWEIPSNRFAERLDQLHKAGISRIASFVPWQAVESDINQSLLRFLQVAAAKQMRVLLILSPELGLHYPYSGLPKDIIQKKENIATFLSGQLNLSTLPPVIFSLPSFFSLNFERRYSGFLSRMDSYFFDLQKLHPNVFANISVCISGSFWKYLRHPALNHEDYFGGEFGDYSAAAMHLFSQKLSQMFLGIFGSNELPTDARFEKKNLKLFFEISEQTFRTKSIETVSKRSHVSIENWEVFTPEADPNFYYENLFRLVPGVQTDFLRLAFFLDQLAVRVQKNLIPYVHWTSLGEIKSLGESQKQFLLLKSYLLFSSQAGGLLLDEQEWFQLSSAFRARIDALQDILVKNDLQILPRIAYYSASLWGTNPLWQALWQQADLSAQIVRHLKQLSSTVEIIIIDPDVFLYHDLIMRLLEYVRAGKIVALSKTEYMSALAAREMLQRTDSVQRVSVHSGFHFEVLFLGLGKLVLYESITNLIGPASEFIRSLLVMGNFEKMFSFSHELPTICLENKLGTQLLLFVLNHGGKLVSTQISFKKKVTVKNFWSMLNDKDYICAEQINLEVPPFGIVPLNLSGISSVLIKENRIAEGLSHETKSTLALIEKTQLPGFGPGYEEFASEGGLWNF